MSVHERQVEITSPCPIELDRSGVGAQDRSMHCAHCVKDVHILSNMSEREARAFLAAHAGENICVSYAKGKDGQIRFRDEGAGGGCGGGCGPSAPTLVPRSSLSRRVRAARTAPPRVASWPARFGAMASALSTAAILTACAPHTEGQMIDDPLLEVAGGMVAPELPPEPIGDVDVPCDVDYEMVEGGLRADPIPEAQPFPDAPLEPVEKTDAERIVHVAGGIGPRDVDLPEPPVPDEQPLVEDLPKIEPAPDDVMVRGGIGRAVLPETDDAAM